MEIAKPIVLTNHAVERLFERFPNVCKEKGISFEDVDFKYINGSKVWKSVLKSIFKRSKENRMFKNNINFMMRFYEKYGFSDKQYFFDDLATGMRMAFVEDAKVLRLVTIMKIKVANKFKRNKQFNRQSKKIITISDFDKMSAPQLKRFSKSAFIDLEKTNNSLITSNLPTENVDTEGGKKSKLISVWTNPGKVKDANGYYVIESEKFETANLNLGCYNKLARKLMAMIVPEDFNGNLPDELGMYKFHRFYSGYVFVFRKKVAKSVNVFQIDEVFKVVEE